MKTARTKADNTTERNRTMNQDAWYDAYEESRVTYEARKFTIASKTRNCAYAIPEYVEDLESQIRRLVARIRTANIPKEDMEKIERSIDRVSKASGRLAYRVDALIDSLR